MVGLSLLVLVVGLPALVALGPGPTHGPPAGGPLVVSASAGIDPATPPLPTASQPYPTDMPASVVLGQPTLLSNNSSAASATTLGGAGYAIAFDAVGDLWVADFDNNRVLEFVPPFTNGMSASLVLGQSTFTGDLANTTATNLSRPDGLAFDPSGNLWVADYANNRVVEFPHPFSTGEAAVTVLGQGSMTTGASGAGPAGLSGPSVIAFHAGNLWVADYGNNRVLEFPGPTLSTGESASLVIGQQNFNGVLGGTSAINLSAPASVAFTPSGELWVADYGNERALEFPAPFSTGEAATVVLGQSNFTTAATPGPNALSGPNGVSVDPRGDVWIADTLHNRVLEYQGPAFVTNQSPAAVIGQPNLTSTAPHSGARGLYAPTLAAFGPNGDLWVEDQYNNRVLGYLPTPYTVQVTESGLPSGMNWSAILNNQSARGSSSATLTFSEIDGSYPLVVPPVAGYGANPAYSTVYVNGSNLLVNVTFAAVPPNPYSTGMAATIVLGQSNFWTNPPIPTGGMNASNFGSPGYAMAFDAKGDLWVADSASNRILEFVPPFTDGMAAALVLGQTSFSGDLSNTTATNLSFPDGLAFDPSGNLWVSDFRNNRVVEFPAPFSTGEAAVTVLGQVSLTNSSAGTGPARLNGPSEIAFHGGNLWVADYYNNRVLEFPGPTLTSGESAKLVLGQQSLSGNFAGTTALNLSNPGAIAFAPNGDLWVADDGNNRALEYPAPVVTGEAATVVLGQANFTSSVTTGDGNFHDDNGVSVDAAGNVWVSDSGHNRVLEFTGPSLVTDQRPALVIGQGNFSTTTSSLGPSGLSYPTLAVVGPHGVLWVDDLSNDRVLGYGPTEYQVTFQATGAKAPAAWNLTTNGTSQTVTGTSASLALVNGSLTWNASAPGWQLALGRGTVVVNGADVTVNLAFTQVTYVVTFTESGLARGTNWSVTLGGITQQSPAGTSIVFTEPNGTYPYTIATVAGYHAPSPAAGAVRVHAGPAAAQIAFTANSTTGSTSPISTGDYLAIAVVVLVLLGLVAFLVLRRRRTGGSGPASRTPAAPPPGVVGGTGGAAAAPPPEQGPPPGASG